MYMYFLHSVPPFTFHNGKGITDLPELHEDVDDAEEAAGGERVLGLAPGHVLVVEEALPLGEPAQHHMLKFLGHLLLHLHLHPSEQEGAEHLGAGLKLNSEGRVSDSMA